MTSLPELDSELGVLKFLKWKTRLLALDVIRSNSRATMAPIDDQPEFASNDPEISQDLERAEDAAIVSMALAKLQPRHREALIATLYEEKPQEVVAAQMGLSDNAFRQLLFRARAAFKKALIGEAETAGLSMSQILSIAARKAAAESGKYISAAGAFLLVLAISIGVLPNLSPSVSEQQISAPEPTITAPSEPEEAASPEPENVSQDLQIEEIVSVEDGEAVVISASEQNGTASVQTESVLTERSIILSTVQPLLGSRTLQQLSLGDKGEVIESSAQEIVVENAAGLRANITYDLATENGIQAAYFEFKIGDALFYALPKTWAATKTLDAQGRTVLSLGATDLVVGNVDGKLGDIVIEKSILGNGKIRLEVILDAANSPVTSSLTIKGTY
jgi:RNA polymerase sigma-70 factor (ECF subfamily)